MSKVILSKTMRDELNKRKEEEHGDEYKACLDHGFVRLVDSMGTDVSIEEAARISYGAGTRKTSQTRGLIRFLLMHKHTTPFEMVEFKFHARMPIFVAREWIRHRTANVNEYSARYSIMPNDYYVPLRENMGTQSKSNNQGQGEIVNEEEYPEYAATIRSVCDNAYGRYEFLLNDKDWIYHNPARNGIAKELARMVLPVNFYTEWYWKIDLHNLFHFLNLRTNPKAQYEIRVFANAMYELIKPIVPIACEAFEDYTLKAETFSQKEMEVVKEIVSYAIDFHACDIDDILAQAWEEFDLTKREKLELTQKLA